MIEELFALPFMDLLYEAQKIHRENHTPNTMQVHTLLSVKTGGCMEDCAYCPQSAHFKTGVKRQRLMQLADVKKAAIRAKENGACRISIAAQGLKPDSIDFDQILTMIETVKAVGLSVCATLGVLSTAQIQQLEKAGLDFYNHNLDTSPEYYSKIITTHTYQDRLDTLYRLSKSKIKICCGGIIGMGERLSDRIALLQQLTNLPKPPAMVPINLLIKIPGTPLENMESIDPFALVRMIAVTRITLPRATIALAAGRNEINDEMHALCFLAGANAMHCGEKLLVTALPGVDHDKQLLQRLDIEICN